MFIHGDHAVVRGAPIRGHAIVIGASMAGLAAAASLASRFARVTLVERRALPDGWGSLAPQGRMPHVLLRAGAAALERMLPGLHDDLAQAGAEIATASNGRWWSGAWRVRGDSPGAAPLATRGLLETIVRRRVMALPNVRFVHATVTALAMDAGRVTGVACRPGDNAHVDLEADLVVDCSGRGSPLASWLGALGLDAPDRTEIGIDLCYVAATFERRADDLGDDRYIVIQNMPPARRLGLALAIESNRWMVLLGGYFGDRPPTDRAGFVQFCDSLPVPDIANLVRDRPMIAEPVAYRFGCSRRVHFERLAMPPGLVVLGDALASFNPLYGQGMSVAAMQAERLGELVERIHDPARLTKVATRQLARIADGAWQLAAGADFAYSQTRGDKPRGTDRINRYIGEVIRACSVDPVIANAMFDVQHLLAAPPSLLRPGILARVLFARRRLRAANAADAVPVLSAR